MSVFVSYSHEDESWKDRVVSHLRVLEKQGDIQLWDDRQIVPGENWSDAIREALDVASVALLLVSANSLTSDFILGDELPALLKRRALKGLHLIPVIVRPCAWLDVSWLAPIQAFPRDGRALSTLTEGEVDTELTDLVHHVLMAMRYAAQLESGSVSPPTTPPALAFATAGAPVERLDVDPLDRYELVKVVQTGNYGRVLKCTLRETGETCIVKETDVERVSERALEALARIVCPNIAGPTRVWMTAEKVYEQLPYVGGVALEDAVAPGLGGLNGGMLESFQQQICQVLKTLHSAGIIHRDIHPANIYLVVKRPSELAELHETPDSAENGWIFDAFGAGENAFLVAWVVVDLTFAALDDDVDQEAYRHGPYTPEEQLDAAATTASDMYALGATMSFGRTGVDPPSPLDRRMNPTAESVPTDHAGFDRYILRLLALDPAERPPATERLDLGSLAPHFYGVLRVDDDQYAWVDMFPSNTRIVSRREALRELRQLQREWSSESRQWLTSWINWLSEG